MPQIRYWDYGLPLESIDSVFVDGALNNPGVYAGLNLTIDISGLLTVNPGTGLQPDGVVWTEDVAIKLPFIPPGAPTDYTVVATHTWVTQFAGAAVEYDVVVGLFSTVTDGIVLGWIYHPGGGVALVQDNLQDVLPALPQTYANAVGAYAPIEMVPAYPRCYNDVASSGIDTTLSPLLFETVGQFLIYQQVANSATAPGMESFIQHFQFYADPRPVSFDIYCFIPNAPLTNIVVQVYDATQVLVPVDGGPLTNTAGLWETKTVTVRRNLGTFTPGLPYTMRLVYNLDIGQTIKTGRIRANFWPYIP